MIRTTTFAATVSALALAAQPLMAQDGGLYPDPGAPDASFVRVIAPGAAEATIDGEDVAIGDTGVSPYVEVSPGAVTLAEDGESSEIEVGANTHYTYADGRLIEDAVKDSPAQADLLLYNLASLEDYDLYAVEADTAALSDVAPGAHDGVGLKAPLTLTFEIRKSGETLTALDPVDLRRGTATTIVLTGEAADVSAAETTSTYAE